MLAERRRRTGPGPRLEEASAECSRASFKAHARSASRWASNDVSSGCSSTVSMSERETWEPGAWSARRAELDLYYRLLGVSACESLETCLWTDVPRRSDRFSPHVSVVLVLAAPPVDGTSSGSSGSALSSPSARPAIQACGQSKEQTNAESCDLSILIAIPTWPTPIGVSRTPRTQPVTNQSASDC